MTFDEIKTGSYWGDAHRIVFNKDCRSMSELPNEFVQMVVTSPPFWGLRKYAGLPDLIWGGDNCQHKWGNQIPPPNAKSGKHQGILGAVNEAQDSVRFTGNLGCWCSLCGSWKGQLGLEPTPEMYISHLIEIFREVRRALRKDGVVFLNIGDSYAGSNFGKGDYREKKGLQKDIYDYEHSQAGRWDKWRRGIGGEENGVSLSGIPRPLNLKPKDLCLIPFRLAIALQEDGWWCRSVIIWSKNNPMPESVTDRPTESHEYILMLTKSAKYYYDQEAVREAYTEPLNRWGGPEFRESSHKYIELGGHDGEQHYGATSMFRKGRPVRPIESGRNLRSVWTFPTQPYPEAHFATYPEKLVEICVKAATPEAGCCSKCGKPWVRIIDTTYNWQTKSKTLGTKQKQRQQEFGSYAIPGHALKEVETLGWQPQCKCNAEKVPSIVLDPFAGSGTTLKVAAELNRRAIGYELSGEYCRLIVDRNKQGILAYSQKEAI